MSAEELGMTIGIVLVDDRIVVARGDAGPVSQRRPAGPTPEAECSALADALEAVQATGSTKRMRVVLALGPARADLRALHRPPAIDDSALLRTVLQANAARFFADVPGGTVVGPVVTQSQGAAWGTAYPAPLLRALVAELRERGHRSLTVMPLLALLAAEESRARTVVDGGLVVELNSHGGEPTQARRRWAGAIEGVPAPHDDEELAAWARLASRARASRHQAPARLLVPTPRTRAWSVASGCLAAAALVWWLVAPSLALRAAREASERRVAVLTTGPGGAQAGARVEARRTLDSLEARRHDLAGRTLAGGGALATLDRLRHLLPEDAALAAIAVDSGQVVLEVVAGRMTEVLDALAHDAEQLAVVGSIDRVKPPTVVAPSPEATAPAPLERVTIRFRLRPSPPSTPARVPSLARRREGAVVAPAPIAAAASDDLRAAGGAP